MKKLSCEIEYMFCVGQNGKISISKAFLRCLSDAVTPYIADILKVDNVADYVSIKVGRFYNLRYTDDYGQMNVEIVHKTKPFSLCVFLVKWKSKIGEYIPQITDDVKSEDIEIKIEMDDWSKENLKTSFFRECYFPIIRKEQSGLHFDYQINPGSENMLCKIQFCDAVPNLLSMSTLIKSYFMEIDLNGNAFEPRRFELKQKGSKTVTIEVDFGSRNDIMNVIEDFMCYLDKNFDNIKRVKMF